MTVLFDTKLGRSLAGRTWRFNRDTFALLFLVIMALPAALSADERGFALGLGTEAGGSALSKLRLGVTLTGEVRPAPQFSFGIRGAGALVDLNMGFNYIDPRYITTFDALALARYYFISRKTAQPSAEFFLEANGGIRIVSQEVSRRHTISAQAEVGGAAGIRILFNRRIYPGENTANTNPWLYLEPFIRGAYPLSFSAGFLVGGRIRTHPDAAAFAVVETKPQKKPEPDESPPEETPAEPEPALVRAEPNQADAAARAAEDAAARAAAAKAAEDAAARAAAAKAAEDAAAKAAAAKAAEDAAARAAAAKAAEDAAARAAAARAAEAAAARAAAAIAAEDAAARAAAVPAAPPAPPPAAPFVPPVEPAIPATVEAAENPAPATALDVFSIMFAPDTAVYDGPALQRTVREENRESLRRIAALLKASPETQVVIEGAAEVLFLSRKAIQSLPLTISERRAFAVIEYLHAAGIDLSRVVLPGKEDVPAPRDGRAQRIEVRVIR
jgi:outer membrane protein OmpA-like peptidoglycan-associated protein